MAAIIEGTSKHVQFELASPYESKFAIEILRAILGSDEKIRARKIASVLYCPVSPLTQDKNMLDAYLELADYDVPINIYPMPMIGMTSPASIFSTICQINAEVLSAVVLFRNHQAGLAADLRGGIRGGRSDHRRVRQKRRSGTGQPRRYRDGQVLRPALCSHRRRQL